MTILKALKYKYCLSLGTCHEYLVQFSEANSYNLLIFQKS